MIVKNFINESNYKRIKTNNNFSLKDSETEEKMIKFFKEADYQSQTERINLIKNIYTFIYSKKNELAVKLCDYFLQKYSNTFSLNYIIFSILAESFNFTDGLETARIFYDKAVEFVSWQFGDEHPSLVDLHYSFVLILLKQHSISENYNEIFCLLDKAAFIAQKVLYLL